MYIAVCASRQEPQSLGPYSIQRELSLTRPVGLVTRCPPTIVGTQDRKSPSAVWIALFLFLAATLLPGTIRPMIIPWTVEDSRIIHADKWIELRADRVKTATGVLIDPYYTVSDKDWTCVVAITADEQVVFVRQYRHGTCQIYLELPGGHVDKADISPVDGGMRELLEETGYSSENATYIGKYVCNPARMTNHMHVILAPNAVKVGSAKLEHGEELEVELIPLSDAILAAMDGRLSQSMHIAALFLAREALQNSKG